MAPRRPPSDLAVVACADIDCDALAWLRLVPGEVHLMTNAGGVVTDDTVSDLALARTRFGVARVIVVQHRPCGLTAAGAGRPEDPLDRLHASLTRLMRSPLCLPAHAVHGVLRRVGGSLTRVDPRETDPATCERRRTHAHHRLR